MRKLIIAFALMMIIAVPAMADRSVEGSTVTIDPVEGENGIMELCFEVWNGSNFLGNIGAGFYLPGASF